MTDLQWWQQLYDSVCALLDDMHVLGELNVFTILRDTYHTYFKHSDRVEAVRLLAHKMLSMLLYELRHKVGLPRVLSYKMRTNVFVNSLGLDVCY